MDSFRTACSITSSARIDGEIMITDKHFVEFFSPGTFVSESSQLPIDDWDIKKAIELSKEITERYNATPYGFVFRTYRVSDPIDDGQGGTLTIEKKELKKSGLYYITGKVLTYDQLSVSKSKDIEILVSNMRCNLWPAVVENTNSWRFTGQFDENDCVVDYEGNVLRRGSDKDLQELKVKMKEERDKRWAK